MFLIGGFPYKGDLSWEEYLRIYHQRVRMAYLTTIETRWFLGIGFIANILLVALVNLLILLLIPIWTIGAAVGRLRHRA